MKPRSIALSLFLACGLIGATALPAANAAEAASAEPVKNIVLVHGFSASTHAWDAWAKALSSDYRVVILDLPGHGLLKLAGACRGGNVTKRDG